MERRPISKVARSGPLELTEANERMAPRPLDRRNALLIAVVSLGVLLPLGALGMYWHAFAAARRTEAAHSALRVGMTLEEALSRVDGWTQLQTRPDEPPETWSLVQNGLIVSCYGGPWMVHAYSAKDGLTEIASCTSPEEALKVLVPRARELGYREFYFTFSGAFSWKRGEFWFILDKDWRIVSVSQVYWHYWYQGHLRMC